MIIFTVLTLILSLLIMITAFAIAIGGASFIIIFGDVIVCIVFIGIILRTISKKRKDKKE